MSQRLCDLYDADCDPKCPGCVLADGGQWNGTTWVYPEPVDERITGRAERGRALADESYRRYAIAVHPPFAP